MVRMFIGVTFNLHHHLTAIKGSLDNFISHFSSPLLHFLIPQYLPDIVQVFFGHSIDIYTNTALKNKNIILILSLDFCFSTRL